MKSGKTGGCCHSWSATLQSRPRHRQRHVRSLPAQLLQVVMTPQRAQQRTVARPLRQTQASSKPASASAQAYAQPARAKTPSAPPPPPPRKRGKAAKARRAKEKYKNQDDEDAALLAEANAATGPAKSRATRRAERKAKNAAKKAAVLEVWLSSTVLNAHGDECYLACSLWCATFSVAAFPLASKDGHVREQLSVRCNKAMIHHE